MKKIPFPVAYPCTLIILTLMLSGCSWFSKNEVKEDDAKLLGKTADDFPSLSVDVFHKMDNGAQLSDAEIRGRNDWILWTGGSQVFLERLSRESYGLSDTLKLIDSRDRPRRFDDFGLVNEPGYKTPAKPDKYGVWIDVPVEGAGDNVDAAIAEAGIDESVYGRSTGIMGLRLYPNPDFDAEAQAKWDAEKYYNVDDKPEWRDYSINPELVRPYKVGMTCGICHVAPNPLNPPENPTEPAWENLVSALGNQYFREGAVFASNLKPPKDGQPSSFLWEMLDAQPPGTSDTSRVATDHINNPNAINAIFNVPSRLEVATEVGAFEKMGQDTLYLYGDDQPGDTDTKRYVPHILKDGADSIGVPGATIRVYINIGMYSQQWLQLHKPLIGVKHQEPIRIEDAQNNSTYWMATQNRLGDIKAFLASVRPMHLKDARWTDGNGNEHSGAEFVLDEDDPLMIRGKQIFAENCAACHSSKRKAEGQTWEEVVMAPDFREDNFLSTDERIPVNKEKLGTNSARAMATNAIRGNIWDNFSSETYKSLPSVGMIDYYNPLTGKNEKFQAPAGGLGYYRVPSLISIWTSAPFLHNNTLGTFNGDPSVEGRLEAFDDAAEKLLNPDKRLGVDSIWRFKRESWLEIPLAVLPEVVQVKLRAKDRLREVGGIDSTLVEDGVLRIGPIPAGTPINLLANTDLFLDGIKDADKALSLAELAASVKVALLHVKANNLTGDEARSYLRDTLGQKLLDHSKCPDFVEDKGHYFGTDLPATDKLALKEFLKTL